MGCLGGDLPPAEERKDPHCPILLGGGPLPLKIKGLELKQGGLHYREAVRVTLAGGHPGSGGRNDRSEHRYKSV